MIDAGKKGKPPTFIEVDGQQRSLAELAKAVGITANGLWSRLKHGWSVADAITVPRCLRHGKGVLVPVQIGGRTQTILEWSRESGTPARIILLRIHQEGWTPTEAVFGKGLDVKGRKQTLIEWSRETGTAAHVIRSRLKRGWPAEKAVFEPPNKHPLTEVNGSAHSLSEWARRTGVSRATLWARIHTSNWSLEEAITTPLKKTRGRKKIEVEIQGRTQTLEAWSRETGLPMALLYSRRHNGWPPESLLLPAGARRPEEVIEPEPEVNWPPGSTVRSAKERAGARRLR
jgi:hypothetical protein